MKTKAQKLGESSGAPRRPSGGDLRGGGPRGPHRPRS